MSIETEKRGELRTAAAISDAMQLLAEFGEERARTYLTECGVKCELVERIMLIRYDRRRSASLSRQMAAVW